MAEVNLLNEEKYKTKKQKENKEYLEMWNEDQKKIDCTQK